MSGVVEALADLIEQRGQEVYPPDVFIPPTRGDFAAINALLQRERGHQLDGVAGECYRRAYVSIAAQIRRGDVDVTAALAAELGSDEMREAVAEALGCLCESDEDRAGCDPTSTATAALAAITARLTGQGEA